MNLLAGDIGGTKTTLALFTSEAGMVPLRQETFPSGEFPSLAAVFPGEIANVNRAVFEMAGPVTGGQAQAINLPWVMSEADLRISLATDKVTLLNDLEATAHSLPLFPSKDMRALNDKPGQRGIKTVLAPGTGLSEAVLYQQEGHYHIIPSEGGHTDFALTNLLELELPCNLMAKFRHVSYERVCSGKGIPNIYDLFIQRQVAIEPPDTKDELREANDPTPIIVQHALAGECELCVATLDMFISLLGAEAEESRPGSYPC